MSRANLMGFQRRAAQDGAAPLLKCLRNIKMAREFPAPEEQIAFVRSHQGALLINAPTGIGKTLIAGDIVEELCVNHRMAWLWFAPFTGIVEQTVNVVRREFSNLHPLQPGVNRGLENLQRGTVYVSTWSGMATSNESGRKIRQDGDIPSIDRVLELARARGYEIGLVIDEAHHSFRLNTEAHKFCRDVVRPAVSILLTATPREEEVKKLTTGLGVEYFSRIDIPRDIGVEKKLLKHGVRVALFQAKTPELARLVDFKRLALTEALKAHREIQQLLTDANIEVSPLLMVQADESADGVAWARNILIESGMSEGAVRVHTAKEPDPEFIRIAEDESVEALIFKMAAATGFDAPRAFVLASLRRSRDEDFGLQIIGRIVRKHGNHRIAENPPEELEYGYVFLSDSDAQAGLLGAAERIKAVRDEVSTTTNDVNVVIVGDKPEIQSTPGGVAEVLSQWSIQPRPAKMDESEEEEKRLKRTTTGEAEPLIAAALSDFPRPPGVIAGPRPLYSYPLRSDLQGLPKELFAAEFDIGKTESFTRDVIGNFSVDDEMLALVNKSTEDVVKETVEIFGGDVGFPERIPARIVRAELRREAQMKFGFVIDKDGWLDEDEFRRLLAERLRKSAERKGWNTDDKFIREGMDKIMALRPDVIRRAISWVVAGNSCAAPVAPFPAELRASERLDPSRNNIYEVYPSGMNSWERRFARELDLDTEGVVRWWHRNPVRAKWSVRIPLPGHNGYFPDFVVGVEGRAGDGILLVETKRDINDYKGNAAAKAQAIHPRYRRVMMLLLREETGRWRIVEHNFASGENDAREEFDLERMRAY